MNDNSKPQAIDFAKIVAEMAGAKTMGKNEVSIIGGVIDLQAESESIFEDEQLAPDAKQSAIEKLSRFIPAWQLNENEMTYAIWESIAEINMDTTRKILSGKKIDDELMRARFFGENGDLSLRRDGNRLYWHFIGAPRNDFPPIKNACRFWGEQEKLPEGERVKELRLQENVEALLWGERIVPKSGEAFWREDRVGAIDLVYPVPISDVNVQKQRAKVIYDVYWHNGQPAFVWLKKLVEVQPSKPEN